MYQFVVARGRTIKELDAEVNRFHQIRDQELDEACKKGYDVYIGEKEWFTPCGPGTFQAGMWVVPLSRTVGI